MPIAWNHHRLASDERGMRWLLSAWFGDPWRAYLRHR
jgi:hypothetical protein